MWVFDGNGFTMACLAVWLRKRRPASGVPQWRGGQERRTRRYPAAPAHVAGISVAISGTDFTRRRRGSHPLSLPDPPPPKPLPVIAKLPPELLVGRGPPAPPCPPHT